jgi:hypothetical protein
MSAPDLRAATALARKKQAREHRAEKDDNKTSQIEPSAIDSLIAYLCNLALHSTEARQYLGEQYESLHDAAPFIEGIPLLESILASEVDPASAAAVNTYLATLPPADQMALQVDPTYHQAISAQPVQDAEEALAKLSEKVLNNRYAINQSALNQSGMSASQLMPLLKEAEEINQLLAVLGRRTFADDRASLGSTASKKPAFKKTWNQKPQS